jgi:hypothetical protein
MRKYIFYIFFLCSLTALWAEKGDVNLGFGVEGNMSSDQGWALGRSISVDFQLFKYIVNGVTLTVSDDFKRFTAIEPSLFARWYLPFFDFLRVKSGGVFIQGDLGVSTIIGFFDKNVTPRFLGGLTAGFRFPFKNGDYYAEPFIKSGYPFLFGIGVKAGVRF